MSESRLVRVGVEPSHIEGVVSIRWGGDYLFTTTRQALDAHTVQPSASGGVKSRSRRSRRRQAREAILVAVCGSEKP